MANYCLSKYKWVNDNYKIDFPVPQIVTTTMQEAEEADLNGEYGEFVGIAGALDVLGKQCYAGHEITKEQWETIVNRYPENA